MLITLLTDFGTADYFVASMKGVILSRDPRITVVDVAHEIPRQDIRAAAFTLLSAYGTFPAGSVHVAVVDPGVGSTRRPLAVQAGEHLFVGPDNGLFSYVYDREPGARAFHLTRERFFRTPVSATFHGRDIFAPVAAALATGTSPAEMGEEITDYVRLAPLTPQRTHHGLLEGAVLHIDHFGNCITSLTRAEITGELLERGLHVSVNGREVRHLREYYAEGGAHELFAIWGSAGFLEIAMNGDSAAHHLHAQRGDRVLLHPSG